MNEVMGLAEQLQGEAQLRASLEARLADTSAQLHSTEAAAAEQAQLATAQLQSKIQVLQGQLQDQTSALEKAAEESAAAESARKGAQVQLAEQERQNARLELCIMQLQEQLAEAAQEASHNEQQTAQIDQLQSRVEQLQEQLQEQETKCAQQLNDQAAAEEMHHVELEIAKKEAEGLQAQLHGAEEGKAADMAECIDSHASHSEILEQLQLEHEQEINRCVSCQVLTSTRSQTTSATWHGPRHTEHTSTIA